MPVVLEWAKGVVSPPFYWRNLTWTRYSPVVPRREEFESSDKQSREPPEKYNYGERCIRCAEAIRLSPNALWNRRASFELKTARPSTLTLSGLDTCGSEEKNNSTEFTRIKSMLALHLTVHSNMDRRSVLLFSGIKPRERPSGASRAAQKSWGTAQVQGRTCGAGARDAPENTAVRAADAELRAAPLPADGVNVQQGPAQGDVVHTRLVAETSGVWSTSPWAAR